MKFVRKLLANPALTFAALIFGAFVEIGGNVTFEALLGRALDAHPGPISLVINVILTAFPFLWLAYRSSARLLPWLVGIVLTLWLHWSFLQDGLAYRRSGDTSGVDLAFGLLMLVAPFFIGALCVWIDVVMRDRARPN